jgi:hypothetical protein
VGLFLFHVDHLDIFIVLIDASTRWSYIYLLATKNITFARLLA